MLKNHLSSPRVLTRQVFLLHRHTRRVLETRTVPSLPANAILYRGVTYFGQITLADSQVWLRQPSCIKAYPRAEVELLLLPAEFVASPQFLN